MACAAPGRVLRPQPTVDPASLPAWREKGQERALKAESFQDGTWLLQAARENVSTCSQMSRGRPWKPPCALTWGSCCSGSEVVRFVAEILNVLSDENLAEGQKSEPVLVHKFSCESNPEKQKWIMAVDRHANATVKDIVAAEKNQSEMEPPAAQPRSPASHAKSDCRDCSSDSSSSSSASSGEGELCASSGVCVFRDIQDMGKSSADCIAHNQRCAVPAVDVLVIGTSCKDMSRANPSAPKGLVLKQDSSRGGSAQTFRGFLAYLEQHSLSVIFFENVDAMADESKTGESNLDVFRAETASRGYECQVVMTDALQFGVPAHRRRVYILLLKSSNSGLLDFGARPLAGMFATFGALMNGCLRSVPCARLLWLEPNDPAVLHELQARQDKRENERIRKEKEKEKESKNPDKVPSAPVGGAWVDQHRHFAQALKRRWGTAAPSHLQGNPWFQVLTLREQDALPHLQAESPSSIFRDLSQSINRANANSLDGERGVHVAPTILPRQQLWMEADEPEDCRLMLGREALMYQGFPALPFLKRVQDEILAALAGPQAAHLTLAQATRPPQTPWIPSEALMQDLAGNAMALPVLLALVQCAFTAISWRPNVSALASPQATALPCAVLGFCFFLFVSYLI